VYCDIWCIFLIPQFFRYQKMDKFQKHTSFNAQWGITTYKCCSNILLSHEKKNDVYY